jgi:hypothetical protein
LPSPARADIVVNMPESRTIIRDRSPMTEEDAERYAGKWVLVHDGEVVAASTDIEEVQEVRAARSDPTDSVAAVPEDPEIS